MKLVLGMSWWKSVGEWNGKNLFFMHLDVYEDLVYECYSSLLMPTHENGNMIGYTMSFRISGDNYKVEPKKFA